MEEEMIASQTLKWTSNRKNYKESQIFNQEATQYAI